MNIFLICLTDSVKSFITSVSQITEIWQIVSYEMINLDVTNSIVLHFFMLTLRKTIFSFFSSEICTLELHISGMAWGILMIHFGTFKALSNKSNLYFACSSPLSVFLGQLVPNNGIKNTSRDHLMNIKPHHTVSCIILR